MDPLTTDARPLAGRALRTWDLLGSGSACEIKSLSPQVPRLPARFASSAPVARAVAAHSLKWRRGS
jgi:hypothetical protein